MPSNTTAPRTHTIAATDWQLAKAQADEGLSAIVLPFDDGEWLPDDLSNCQLSADGRMLCDRPGWSNGWGFGISWRVGDRICFAEPWVYSNKRKKVQARSWFHEDADEFAQWQPPQFMPEEAARFWFEVTGIHVEQIKRIPLQVFVDAGLYQMDEDESEYGAMAIARWNDAHAKHPYKSDMWAIVLVVKAVDFLEEE